MVSQVKIMTTNTTIIDTPDDRSIMEAGLIEQDPYVDLLLPIVGADEEEVEGDNNTCRRRDHLRSPLINRGTFIRSVYIDQLIKKATQPAASSDPHDVWIVSLGAGYDTRPFRMRNQIGGGYIEFDLPTVVERKEAVMNGSNLIDGGVNGGDGDAAKFYHLHPMNLDSEASIDRLIELFQRIVPRNAGRVVVLAECIFMYLQPRNVGRLLERLSSVQPITLIGFEPIMSGGGDRDPFGRVMLENLADRQLPLDWLKSIRTPANLEAFMRQHLHGGDHYQVNLVPMDQAEGLLDEQARQILQTRCILDEYEEWHLFCRHYLFYECWSNPS